MTAAAHIAATRAWERVHRDLIEAQRVVRAGCWLWEWELRARGVR